MNKFELPARPTANSAERNPLAVMAVPKVALGKKKRPRPNYRLVKIHKSYTMEEAAVLLKVHKHTVRDWIRRGLTILDNSRPILIMGGDLIEYLKAKRLKNKQTCKLWEIFCLGCRAPRNPAEGMADYKPTTPNLGSLIGICPDCGNLIYKSINPAQLEQIGDKLEIRYTKASRHISETTDPLVNSDLRQEAFDGSKTQPD